MTASRTQQSSADTGRNRTWVQLCERVVGVALSEVRGQASSGAFG